ncbi:MAG TPA: multidrug transporter [Anaerolineae bacterium]|nr:multidrug transporter [Anaerolineae bacterium]
MPNTKTKTQTNYRDAETGKFVPKDYAIKHPKTTVKETDKVPVQKTPKKK